DGERLALVRQKVDRLLDPRLIGAGEIDRRELVVVRRQHHQAAPLRLHREGARVADQRERLADGRRARHAEVEHHQLAAAGDGGDRRGGGGAERSDLRQRQEVLAQQARLAGGGQRDDVDRRAAAGAGRVDGDVGDLAVPRDGGVEGAGQREAGAQPGGVVAAEGDDVDLTGRAVDHDRVALDRDGGRVAAARVRQDDLDRAGVDAGRDAADDAAGAGARDDLDRGVADAQGGQLAEVLALDQDELADGDL